MNLSSTVAYGEQGVDELGEVSVSDRRGDQVGELWYSGLTSLPLWTTYLRLPVADNRTAGR